MSAQCKTVEKVSVNSQKLGSRTRRSGEVKFESSFTLSVANRTSGPFHVTALEERTYRTSVHPLHHLPPQNVDLEARWKSAQTNARVQLFRNFTRRLRHRLTSIPQWTTPRSPYVIHGGYSAIHVELLTRMAST
jgi:hypothetical protein